MYVCMYVYIHLSQIEMADGTKEFFTSFFSREDAFRIIDVTWRETKRTSSAANGTGDAVHDAAAVSEGGTAVAADGAGARRSRGLHGRTLSDAAASVASADTPSPEPGSEGGRRGGGGGGHPCCSARAPVRQVSVSGCCRLSFAGSIVCLTCCRQGN